MKSKKLEVEVKWDNGRTTLVGKFDYETYKIIEGILVEASMGNAVALWVNGGMSLSVPEKHSGEFRHVADIADGKPLATKRRDD